MPLLPTPLSKQLLFLVLFGFIRQSNATTFKPNCTFPPPSSNLVLAADVRGTFEILWTSIFALVTCCWTVLHLNIPRRRSKKTKLKSTVSKIIGFWPKFKWMVLTLIIPEFLVGKALQDRHLAKASVDEMKDLAKTAGFDWTVTHGFYADMGGFALDARSVIDGELVQTPLPLNVRSLKYACGKANIIENLPHITEDEIKDKSKGDLFVKVIAAGQLLWLIIQTAARGIKGLAISQLEIAVLAYAALTIITFFLCLSKPKDVQVPTIIPVSAGVGEKELSKQQGFELGKRRPHSWFSISLRLRRYRSQIPLNSTERLLSSMPNDGRYPHRVAMSMIFPEWALLTRMDDGFIIGGIVFGSIHCAAWFAQFPTPVERLLWRIASMVTAGILPLYYCVLLTDIHLKTVPLIRFIIPAIEFLLAVAYVFARLTLLIEVFRSLYFLPPSAYVVTWSSEIPHVS
jgi:hypothetical protein